MSCNLTTSLFYLFKRLLFFSFIFIASPLLAQTPITGTVFDDLGEPVIGATVSIKGTTTGVITDVNGTFNIVATAKDILQFSYVGMSTVERLAEESSSITLSADALNVEDVVVTALGIKREEKALSYNVQGVTSKDINTVKDANLMNSLSGKVAGLNINASSAGAGGATKVVMRGTKGISQSSNALYVIDGIPMFNLGGSGSTEFGSQGSSEGIADINPEDIESISVLTGAAAAALYGSYGSNGAIVVTTKKGEVGKIKVNVSSQTEFAQPFILPKFQNRYGTGSGGLSTGSRDKSWGALLNGSNFMGYSPKQDFLELGMIFNNSVSISAGTKKNQTYFSAGMVNSEGIVPNNRYDRFNLTLKNTTKLLKDKITLDIGGSYISQKDQNMINQGTYSNPLVSAYLFPRGDDFDQIRAFERYDAASKISTQYWPSGPGEFRMQNPYWTAERNLRNNSKDRYMINASASYDILDWLNVSGHMRIDNSINTFTEKIYATSDETIAEGKRGLYGNAITKEWQTYGDIMININKSFKDFSLQANVGAIISDVRSDQLKVRGPIAEEGIPNVFNVQNLDPIKSRHTQEGWREQTQSVFASVELSYKRWVYLTLTGRNDWPSQLAGPKSKASSFFYPSVGLSIMFSEIFKMPEQIDYLKLRGSYASVGLPFARFLAYPTYGWNPDNNVWEPKTHYPFYELKPERTDSYEVGISAKFFKSVSMDVTFYNTNTFNQTFDPQISVSSGYETLFVQTGNVRNMGLEASLGYNNTWGDFSWSSGATFSFNKNTIMELVDNYVHPETGEIINKDRLDVGGLARARFILKEGGSLGDLYSIADFKRDGDGNILVDSKGDLSTVYNVEDIKLGSVLPKCNLAWRNDFSWRGFNLGILITARIGGVVYSATQAGMDLYGVSEASAIARDNGGVIINGGDKISAETWYTAIGSQSGLPQHYTYSATNIRLQELSFGYTLPKRYTKDIVSITLSFVARNLLMIYCKAPFDPESVASTGNYYQGIDNFMTPNTRNMGFSLNLKF